MIGASIAFVIGISSADAGLFKRKPSTIQFAGTSINMTSAYLYSGFIMKPDRELYEDGLLIKAMSGTGIYTYFADTKPRRRVRGFIREAEFMIGHQQFHKKIRSSIFLGSTIQEHRLSRFDSENPMRGRKAGLKAELELLGINIQPYHAKFHVTGTLVNHSIKAQLQLGWTNDRWTVGAEAGVVSNISYDAQDIGAFVMYRWKERTYLTCAGGFSMSHTGDGSGLYSRLNAAWVY